MAWWVTLSIHTELVLIVLLILMRRKHLIRLVRRIVLELACRRGTVVWHSSISTSKVSSRGWRLVITKLIILRDSRSGIINWLFKIYGLFLVLIQWILIEFNELYFTGISFLVQ